LAGFLTLELHQTVGLSRKQEAALYALLRGELTGGVALNKNPIRDETIVGRQIRAWLSRRQRRKVDFAYREDLLALVLLLRTVPIATKLARRVLQAKKRANSAILWNCLLKNPREYRFPRFRLVMKTIAIPLLRTKISIGAVGTIEILTKTCVLWRQLNERAPNGPLFDVQTVAEDRKPITFANGITLRPSNTLSNSKPDLIVVPSLDDDVDSCLDDNQDYVTWVRQSFKRGAHISSLCTGAFILGAAGVLDGRRATTHWFFAKEFRRMFPQVYLQEGHILVDEGDIVTCGGATTFLNLLIYLIEKYFTHELAVYASKIFLIDMDRSSQLPFKIQSFSTAHGEQAIARIQAFIAEHLAENLIILDLARKAGMSIRNFSRRFKNATGESFVNYVQKVRIEKAKRLLENSTSPASEIMYQVGYNDHRSFRRLFKKHTGLAPKHYRNKFKLRFENIT
jgi:transcriptional regulator GlxA family with amidase domain